jgi:hypothetical protein
MIHRLRVESVKLRIPPIILLSIPIAKAARAFSPLAAHSIPLHHASTATYPRPSQILDLTINPSGSENLAVASSLAYYGASCVDFGTRLQLPSPNFRELFCRPRLLFFYPHSRCVFHLCTFNVFFFNSLLPPPPAGLNPSVCTQISCGSSRVRVPCCADIPMTTSVRPVVELEA